MKDTALYREWRHGWSLQPPEPFVLSMRRLYHELGPETCRDLVAIGPVVVEGGAFQIHEDSEWAFLTPVCWCDPDDWRFHVWGPTNKNGRLIPWGEGFWDYNGEWVPGLGIGAWTPDMAWRQLAEVIDIVAWHPATPGQWARRTGLVDMLGEIDAEGLLRVHQTPYGWLRAGGEGVCFLDPDRASVASALRLAEQIVADNAAHARELRNICARPYPIPKIGVAA